MSISYAGAFSHTASTRGNKDGLTSHLLLLDNLFTRVILFHNIVELWE
jgi:hypothetical protein